MGWNFFHRRLILFLFIIIKLLHTSDGQMVLAYTTFATPTDNSITTITDSSTTTTTTDSSTTTTTDDSTTTTTDDSTMTTTDDSITTDSNNGATTVDLLTLATNSIQNLFDDFNNPTRLVQPDGGVPIDAAISAADANLNALQMTNQYPNEVENLNQLLGFAKGLQILLPYFTDLTMAQVSASGQNATDLVYTNSSINNLGITNTTYKQILDDLMALLGTTAATTAAENETSNGASDSTDTTTSTAAITTAAGNDTSNNTSDFTGTTAATTAAETSNSTSNSTDPNSELPYPKEPLSLAAQRMIIKAMLRRDSLNSMFPRLPTSSGNKAAYAVIVRQNGVVVEGKYTLGGVAPSAYDSVTCIYYNDINAEIKRSVTVDKPGSCLVTEASTPGVVKLEMQVNGILSAPTDGYITLDGTYTPTGTLSNYGNIFGGKDSEICTTMRVSLVNMPSEQIKVDPNSGTLTWIIVPKRFDSNSIVQLKKVLVQASDNSIGTITIIPYARQNDDQTVQLNSISGQANLPIVGFPNDYNADIFFIFVTMTPVDFSSGIDPNVVSVNVDYCSVIGNPNTPPILNSIQPSGTLFKPSYQQTYVSEQGNVATQINPASSVSCNQPQPLSVGINSPYVVVQGNIWRINIGEPYGSPVPVNSLQVNTQGQLVSGSVLLTLVDANQQQSGPYVSQMNTGWPLIFQNLPSTPISFVQLQFPDGTQSTDYLVNIVVCLQTNVPPPPPPPPPPANPQGNQLLIAPAPLPIQNSPNIGQITNNGATPQTQSQQVPANGYASQPGKLWQLEQSSQPGKLSQVEQSNQTGKLSQLEQSNQTGKLWPLEQSNQTGQVGRSVGFYNGPNGRGPLPVPGLNNQNINRPQPSFGQNNSHPSGQYSHNQYGTGQIAPPLTLQYTDDEVPCTLYLVRPGSRRIVVNTTDGQRITWLLQVPLKPGYISVPNCITVHKTPLTQLGVNYLNADQSPASMSNGTALQFVSAPNMNDIGILPEHVPAQMLQVNIDGAPAPLPPASLEVHIIICYEPLLQIQPPQPAPQYQQPQQPPQPPPQPSPQRPSQPPPQRPSQPFLQPPPQRPSQPPPQQQPAPQHQPSESRPQPQQPTPQHRPSEPRPQPPQQPQQPKQPIPQPPPHQQPLQPAPQFQQPQIPPPAQPAPQYQQPFPQPQPQPQPQQPVIRVPQQPVITTAPSTTTVATTTTTVATTTTTVATTTTTTSTTTTPGYCSCTCQCPYGAAQPQIQGASVNYQYSPSSEQQLGRRRRRRSDTSNDFNMNKE